LQRALGACCRYNEEIEVEDAIHTAILTLKEGFEVPSPRHPTQLRWAARPSVVCGSIMLPCLQGHMTESTLEIGIVDSSGFRVLSPAEIKDYLGEVE
jgi:20S proteasome subunit alpha 2